MPTKSDKDSTSSTPKVPAKESAAKPSSKSKKQLEDDDDDLEDDDADFDTKPAKNRLQNHLQKI
jgi:nucleolin